MMMAAGIMVPLSIAGGLFWLLGVIGIWKIFQKAGKPGWHAIIPILVIYDLLEISGKNGWYWLWLLCPVVGHFIFLIISIQASLNLAKAFGKDVWFAVGLIFFGPIFYTILGFSEAKYNAGSIRAKS